MALVTITREQLLKMNDQFGQKKLKELFAKRDNAAKVNGEGSETCNVPTATESVTGDNQ